MKKVFTHDNFLIVGNVKNLLTNAGIDTAVKNEYASGAAGELSPIDAWPELWVAQEDVAKAEDIIKGFAEEPEGTAWVCRNCGERNEPSFEVCWQCQTQKPSAEV